MRSANAQEVEVTTRHIQNSSQVLFIASGGALIGEDLQRGALQAALIDYTPLERSVYAIYLPNRHLSPKVRTFIDFLVARFGPQPYWDRIEQ